MRLKAFFNITEVKVERSPFGRLYINPSSAQFQAMLKRNIDAFRNGKANQDEAFVKGFADFKSNVFWMWDPFNATHQQIAGHLRNTYGLKFGYDADERIVGDLLPIIVGDHPVHGESISFSAPESEAWSHPGIKAALRGLPLIQDRLGDYDLEYDVLPWNTVTEQQVPGWYDEEEEEEKYNDLPTMQAIAAAKPAIIKKVQAKYNQWQQDDTGHDEEVGYGGICHLLADLIAEVLYEAGVPATTVSSSHEVHVYTVAQAQDGVFEVDIPYCVYETGGGYNWTKIQDVQFELDDIIINRLSPDPGDFDQYTEEY